MSGGRGEARVGVALAGLALAAFTFITAETLPIGLLPQIADGLGVSQSAVGLLVSAYAAVVVVATIPLTRLTTRVPRRILLTVLLGLLVVSTAAGAAATSYAVLGAARVGTALAHAVFWAVAVPAAASLVPPERSGRAVAVVYAGISVATVLGIPLSTWIGQAVGWRAAFLGSSLLGAVALVVVAAAMPRTPPVGAAGSGTGSAPDRRRYALLVLVTAVAVTGGMVAFTYVTSFLLEVSRLPQAAVTVLLLLRGAVGLGATLVAGRIADRFPRGLMVAALGVQAAGLALQALAGPVPVLASAGIVASGAAFSAFSAALAVRVLVVAPGSVDVATAGTSTAFNVGIGVGSAAGALVLPLLGLAAIPALAAIAVAAAFVLVLAEPRLAGRPSPISG